MMSKTITTYTVYDYDDDTDDYYTGYKFSRKVTSALSTGALTMNRDYGRPGLNQSP